MMSTMTEAVAQRVNRSARRVLDSSVPSDITDEALAVLAAATRWWARRVEEAGLPEWCGDPGLAFEQVPGFDPAVMYGEEPTPESLDGAPDDLASAYVTALDGRVRALEGRHYTPSPLAVEMWSQTLEVADGPPDGTVLDPACGTGALLIEPLRWWLKERRDMDPELLLRAVPEAVKGFDLDPAAVWLGNLLLGVKLLPYWAQVPEKRRRAMPSLLHVGDGLRVTDSESVAAVIMNPPYGRVRLSDEDRKRWTHVLHGHANRYSLFVAAAMKQVVDAGVATCLIPAGWLGGSYFQRLRAHLAEVASLDRIAYVGDRSGVFATGVLQETVVATFRRGEKQDGTLCRRVEPFSGGFKSINIGVGELPADRSQPWLLPRDDTDRPLVRAAAHMTARLKDYGWAAKTGPLVWNRHKDEISQHPRENSVKIIWAADVEDGAVQQSAKRDKQRYVQIRSEREAKVLVLREPAVLVQRTTAPEQSRRIVATELDARTLERWGGQVVVENHVNVLTCSDPKSPLDRRLLLAILRSDVTDRLYRCLTGSVAVSAYELSALPLPPRDVLEHSMTVDGEELAAAIRETYQERDAEQRHVRR